MIRFLLLLAMVWGAVYAGRRLWARLLPPRDPWRANAPGEEPEPPAPGEGPGEWLHRVLTGAYVVEREGWAVERVTRVADRLQAGRPAEERVRVEILWIPEVNAFATPGGYVYLSRRLLERTVSDEPVAFVLAHEIAHLDLGHLDLFAGWLSRLRHLSGAERVGALYQLLAQRLYGPEREDDADTHAINLCLSAGYDPFRCLRAFDVLEADCLDHGAFAAVFGPESVIDDRLDGRPEWLIEAKEWLWERTAGHPPLRARRDSLAAALREALAGEDGGGHAFPVH